METMTMTMTNGLCVEGLSLVTDGDKYRLERDEESGLFRLIALRDFSDVKAGESGGFVSGPENLDQKGDCWVYNGARAIGNARVSGDARVYGYARVYGDARVFGSARVYGNARVSGSARVYGDARVFGSAHVGCMARVGGNALVSGSAQVFDAATLSEHARVIDMAQIGGTMRIWGNAVVGGTVFLFDCAYVGGEANIECKEHYLYAVLSEGVVSLWRRSDNTFEGYFNGVLGDLKECRAADPELKTVVKIIKARAKNW